MTRIAVLGANGQVGAEVCLLLAARGGDVVPIARNRFGSAFLRYRGLACRHGLVADPAQAPQLLSDCEVVVNLTLASVGGRPAEARRLNRLLAENAARGSAPGARILHGSTIDVYGDHRPRRLVRWRSAYGREKRWGERRALAAGRASGREVYVLRFGHVCGEHQSITHVIRDQIATPPVRIPRIDRPSNCTYTATIVDAILKIAEGQERPGTYDLVNRPQWSWRAVFSYEASRVGRTATFEVVPEPARRTLASRAAGLARGAIRGLARGGLSKELALRTIARLSPSYSGRIQALLYRTRAAAETTELYGAPPPLMAGLDWVDEEHRRLSSLAPTADLLAAGAGDVPRLDRSRSWPADLALAPPR
jgi:nucleoside-diphosphate-sugar epimerase